MSTTNNGLDVLMVAAKLATQSRVVQPSRPTSNGYIPAKQQLQRPFNNNSLSTSCPSQMSVFSAMRARRLMQTMNNMQAGHPRAMGASLKRKRTDTKSSIIYNQQPLKKTLSGCPSDTKSDTITPPSSVNELVQPTKEISPSTTPQTSTTPQVTDSSKILASIASIASNVKPTSISSSLEIQPSTSNTSNTPSTSSEKNQGNHQQVLNQFPSKMYMKQHQLQQQQQLQVRIQHMQRQQQLQLQRQQQLQRQMPQQMQLQRQMPQQMQLQQMMPQQMQLQHLQHNQLLEQNQKQQQQQLLCQQMFNAGALIQQYKQQQPGQQQQFHQQQICTFPQMSYNNPTQHQMAIAAVLAKQNSHMLLNPSSMLSASANKSIVVQAEARRREQRRLSAQKRRERKRYTLNDLETRVRQYQHTDMQLRNQLSLLSSNGQTSSSSNSQTSLSSNGQTSSSSAVLQIPSSLLSNYANNSTTSTTSTTSTSSTTPTTSTTSTTSNISANSIASAKALLDAADQNVLHPTFPNWDSLLQTARQKAMDESHEELVQEQLAAATQSESRLPRDKSTIRRERNRLSARMSRLRKRLRTEYLETMLTLFSERVKLMQHVLTSTNQQPVSFVPQWQ